MVLAGLSSLVPSMAQNAQNPQRLRARVAAPTIKNGRPTDIYILSANGPTVQFVESRESQEVLQQMASAFKTLYIFETDDFVDAKVAMENRKYQEARNKFHALVNKYASTLSIKDSLSARAAVYELECAMRMMDWAGVKGLAAKFPVRGANLSSSAQNDLEVAKIMALIPDKDWNGVKSRAGSFLATKKNATRLQQARMKYALGAAAMVAQDWNKALDYFAEALVLLHGSDEELASACVARSLDAYLRMPDVVKFFENPVVSSAVESRKNNPEAVIPDSRLKSRPAPVKEAAALYRLHELMFPDRKLPAKYDGFAVSYKHPAAVAPAKAPDQAPAQPQKKQ
ncbi:hypothetical protein CXT87_06460 [Akkermansia muciniphila]|nr:hypothetical protein CXT93_01120 [Akkermansia muciniphila]PNC99640.1 hypothetical protein CXT87_06460 [Akkermansia muciniphila]PND03574.1 hypothetical protein CXT86_11510 [Akkermansia muciniphila]PND09894.1 hypothetical protein CXT85_07895 [Akkermansia muciniphila]